jgi:hypothetical protein
MPSDSIAGFLDHAQAVRILFPEQIEQLIRQPDIPQSDLSKLCEYLLSRGVLTQYQADAIRDSRGQELNFAGYPIVDELGPCPGGTSYKALHPSLRTPVVLRRLRTDWLAPADNGPSFVGRARAFGMTPHAHAVLVLDAGFHRDELYVVLDHPSGAADLDSLSREVGGAMPGFLAAEYGRAVASALRLAHQQGGVHGDVRPANLLVAPLTLKDNPDGTVRRRPAPDAVVRLAEFGLVPVRPPASQFPRDPAALPYLPPEQADGAAHDPRGDIYSLGATLYFLLTGRPPFASNDPTELLGLVRSAEPAPLATLRPDLPLELTALVARMMKKDPAQRPATAYDVEVALAPICRPGTGPATPAPLPVPMAAPDTGLPVAEAIPVAVPNTPDPEPVPDWGVADGTFSLATAGGPESAPRRRAATAAERNRTRLLLLLGGLLHVTGIALAIAWALGAFK